MDDTACPKCGSKRLTQLTGTASRPGAVWCHSCGAITDKAPEPEPVAEPDPLEEQILAWLRD
jgi:hypothetical protein